MAKVNLLVRMGMDLSAFYSGMRAAKAEAEKTGEEVSRKLKEVDTAKAQPGTTLADRVGAMLNPNGVKLITEVTKDNLAEAKRQAEDLSAMIVKLQAKGIGPNSTGADADKFYQVRDMLRDVSYAIGEYSAKTWEAADAQREEKAQLDAQAAASARFVEETRAAAAAQRESVQQSQAQAKSTSWYSAALAKLRTMGRSASASISEISHSAKRANPSIDSLVRSIRNIGIVSLGIRIAGAALGRLRSIVSEYISDNEQLQAQVNGLKTAMGQALAPAINVVVNAMSQLMPYVLGVANAIGSLMGNLFGTGWTTAATGASKTAAATKQAATAQKEMNRQLLGFDQITRLEDTSQSAESTSQPSGGSGAPTTSITAKTPAWLERFKQSFSNLFDSEQFKAANIGGKLGQVIQTGLDWLGGEAMQFNWGAAGRKLYDNWAEFWESGVSDSFGHAAGVALGGSLDLLFGFLTEPFARISDKFKNEGLTSGLNYISGILNYISNPVGTILTPVLDGFVDYFKVKASNMVSGFWDSFTQKWDQLKNALTTKLNGLKTSVTDLAAKIKNAFSFSWSLPRLKVPHLSIDWQETGSAFARFFGVSAIPHINVQWYAKGGILDGAQIFGRMGSSLLGGGEAGREAVLPLDRNTEWMDRIADRVVSRLGTSGDVNATINLMVDGRVLVKYVIQGLRAQARASGKAIVGGI